MTFSLRLHILQSGKELYFEKLFKAERMQQDFWEDLVEASTYKDAAERSYYEASLPAVVAWERYEELYKKHMPTLRKYKSSLESKDASNTKSVARARRSLLNILKEARLEHEALQAKATSAQKEFEHAEAMFKLAEENHASANKLLTEASRDYKKSHAALNHLLMRSKM